MSCKNQRLLKNRLWKEIDNLKEKLLKFSQLLWKPTKRFKVLPVVAVVVVDVDVDANYRCWYCFCYLGQLFLLLLFSCCWRFYRWVFCWMKMKLQWPVAAFPANIFIGTVILLLQATLSNHHMTFVFRSASVVYVLLRLLLLWTPTSKLLWINITFNLVIVNASFICKHPLLLL